MNASRGCWIIGTIPVGITGLVLEHALRTVFANPSAAAVFLTLNGVILLIGERLRRRAAVPIPAGTEPAEPGRQLATLRLPEAGLIGLAQTVALFAGISRSGVTMVGGLRAALNHEDAARFAFLLATPGFSQQASTSCPTSSARSVTAYAAKPSLAASPRSVLPTSPSVFSSATSSTARLRRSLCTRSCLASCH